jgi:hypothetical protein
MGKALKASELAQSATAKFVEKERVAAQELIALSKDVTEAQDYLETARMGFWATAVIAFAVQGCTKDGMEAAEPSLKDVTAWRSACSTVKAAREHKVKLLDDDGLPRSKGDIQKDVKAAKEKAAKKAGQTPDPVDVPEESGAGVRKATDAEIINLALNALHQSKELRDQFRAALRDVIRMDAPKKEASAEVQKTDAPLFTPAETMEVRERILAVA